MMKTMQVAEFKRRFSEVLDGVRRGEAVAVSYGRKKEAVAVLLPISHYRGTPRRKLGIMERRASFELHADFKISDDEFLRGE